MMEVLIADKPFHHWIVTDLLCVETERELQAMLLSAEWQLRTGAYYKLYIPKYYSDINKVREFIINDRNYADLLEFVAEVYSCPIAPLAKLEVHRYTEGCGIAPHTDSGFNEIRFILNINRSWEKDYGGIWILANNPSPDADVGFLPPVSNCGLMFRTGRETFHALSLRKGNIGFAITLRFEII